MAIWWSLGASLLCRWNPSDWFWSTEELAIAVEGTRCENFTALVWYFQTGVRHRWR